MTNGFTLAEVLITLAIIGVVAAMTIPTLNSHYKKQEIEVKLKRFYSSMNNAIALSELDNGPMQDWDKIKLASIYDDDGEWLYNKPINVREWFETYLAPYVKYTKIDYIGDISGIAVYLNDGTMFTLDSTFHFFPKAKDCKFNENKGSLDINRSDTGIKVFTFMLSYSDNAQGIQPYGINNNLSDSDLRNNTTLGCNKNATIESAYCTLLIARNDWKIPDDYPIKF